MTMKVIHRLQAFSSAIRRTFVQHFTRFKLTVCSHGSCAFTELLVDYYRSIEQLQLCIVCARLCIVLLVHVAKCNVSVAVWFGL